MNVGGKLEMCFADTVFETETVRNEARVTVRGVMVEGHINHISVNHMVKAKVTGLESLLACSCHILNTVLI